MRSQCGHVAGCCAGGLTGLLALNGLFVLVSRHGLEYPAFYARLYALLTLNVFQVPQRPPPPPPCTSTSTRTRTRDMLQ